MNEAWKAFVPEKSGWKHKGVRCVPLQQRKDGETVDSALGDLQKAHAPNRKAIKCAVRFTQTLAGQSDPTCKAGLLQIRAQDYSFNQTAQLIYTFLMPVI